MKEAESGSNRNWNLMGDINQKQTRPQDKPIPLAQLPEEGKLLVKKYYPKLFK